jgi:hypothetical protein
MSWIENAAQEIIITCGDGKQYRPKWRRPSRELAYQVSEFEFPGVRGTLVERRLPRGRRFPVELYFDGENHVVTARNFETSANDPRAWNIEHPYFGRILVQPVSLTLDDSNLNVTKITGTLLETIGTKYPATNTVPKDKITTDAINTNANIADAYANNTTPTPADVNQMGQQVAESYSGGTSILTTPFAEDYFNAFQTAQGKITNATAQPLAAIRAIQALIMAPALFAATVQARVNVLNNELNGLLNNLTGITLNQKRLFEANGGTIITALMITAANPAANDYANRNSVLAIVDQLVLAYNNYLTAINNLQTPNGGSPLSYIPNATAIASLADLLNYTLANLFDIAAGAKQQRTFTLEDDSNWILLTHRLYGIDNANSNIPLLIAQNDAGLLEMLRVRKGRLVTYYI